MTSLTHDEWVDAIQLAVRDMEAAIENRDRVVREAVEAGVSYQRAAGAAGRSKGWVALVVRRAAA